MTVENLIRNLLKMPMNANVKIVVAEEEKFKYYDADIVVDYEDGDIGILTEGMGYYYE